MQEHRKSETTIYEGIAWFGASFLPVAGPYLSTLGVFKTVLDSLFVGSIRQYADYDHLVSSYVNYKYN